MDRQQLPTAGENPVDMILKRYGDVESHRRYSAEMRLQSSLLSRMPNMLFERPQHMVRDFTSPGTFNKVFASEWYDGNRILLVTKCNQLAVLDVASGMYTIIHLPEREPRSYSTRNVGWGNSGKHCIGFNRSRTMFATGGSDPADVVIVDGYTFETKLSLLGHRDWVFGLAWVTDSHIVTGSRDCSVGLWNIDSDSRRTTTLDRNSVTSEVLQSQETAAGDAVVMNKDFSARVRDVKFCENSRHIVVLTSNAGVKFLDPARELVKIQSFSVPNGIEAVCLALQPDKLGIGCRSQAYLIDARMQARRSRIAVFHSPDGDYGVRSIEFKDHLMSYGTGKGSLVFHDLRCGSSMFTANTSTTDRSLCGILKNPLSGWTRENQYGFNSRIYGGPHAIYSHKWDHSCTRLFFCGGPITCGVDGHFCGLYD